MRSPAISAWFPWRHTTDDVSDAAILLERAAVVGIVLVCACLMLRLWLAEAWMHLELIDSAARVWSLEAKTPIERFWQAFLDYGVLHDRARPVSYVAEIVDILTRPLIAEGLVVNPSLTLVGMLTAIVSPALLYGLLRSYGLRPILAISIVAVFVLSIGFLSTLIAYIRPAKKLTFIFILAALLLARRHELHPNQLTFAGLMAVLLIGFFVDEACLATFVLLPVLYLPMFARTFRRWQWLTYLSLPIIFVGIAIWGLPALFTLLGSPPPIDLTEDPTFGVRLPPIWAFVSPLYHSDWLIFVTRVVLTTLGIRPLGVTLEFCVSVTLILGSFALAALAHRRAKITGVGLRLALSIIALMLSQMYATWLDWHPSRELGTGRAYLAAFTFYYDSWSVVLVVLWLATLWQTLLVLSATRSVQRMIAAGGMVTVVLALTSGISLFSDVNRVMEIIHFYPFTSRSIDERIVAAWPELIASSRSATSEPVPIVIPVSEAELTLEYQETVQRLFRGEQPDFGIHRAFPTELGTAWRLTDDRIGSLVHAYIPRSRVVVTLQSPSPVDRRSQ
jgi:hypothetical protein